jgi:hypothetical protein
MLTSANHALRIARRSNGSARFDDDMNPSNNQFPIRGNCIETFRYSLVPLCQIPQASWTALPRRHAGPVGSMSFTVPAKSGYPRSRQESAGWFSTDRTADAHCLLTHHNRLQYMQCNEPAERPAGAFRRIYGSTQEEGISNRRWSSARTQASGR